MQDDEDIHNARAEGSAIAEPLPQHADAVPLVHISTSAPRLTTRQLAKRRRQWLQELIQQPAN
jgi:hypothetical protein